ncbi:MAG TPA: metal ABC transporter permease [Solirubrobacteraceae bacterium]|nr:metal ABC transporter permease [Solirubrobacteraceae bacterium]
MIDTWIAATIVAAIAGVVGFFVVLRGAAFPAHALPNSAFAGAAAANLLGVGSLLGLGAAAAAAAVLIATLGRRGRTEVATALALVLGLALGSLLLSRSSQYEPQLYSLLFGEILGVSSTQLAPVALLALSCVAAIAVLYRPLLYSSALAEVAQARGVAVGRMQLAFLLVLAGATALTVPVVGALLVFSLMIGPPAGARSLTASPGGAVALSVLIALIAVWAAIALSYLTDWPVGFFVGTLSALAYALGRGWAACRRARATAARSPADPVSAVAPGPRR